ncbi:MAG TPA: hypothetical protein VFE28_07290 [Candidatus Krumholzibacteria bacterium]|nr:hypothetical protein [Candidatus Krumholzibacteria bacterium]
MPPLEPFLVFTQKLNDLGFPYMVSGSVAATFYGEPRLTNDVDIIVVMKRQDVRALETAFPRDLFYCPPAEVIELEITRSQRGHFNLIHHDTGFKADIYLSGQDVLHAWGLAHARHVQLEDGALWLAPPEYVIIRKLQFYREGQSQKHLRDMSRMLASLGPDWDRTQLEAMIREQGLQTEWQRVLAFEG